MFVKKTLIVLPLLALLAGCGDDKNNNPLENIAEAAKDKDLQGSFESECSLKPLGALVDGLLTGFEAAARSARVQYRFEGANVTRTTVLFTTADCGAEALRFEERGEFDLNPDAQKTAENAMPIDMKFRTLVVTAVSADGAEIANGRALCGAADWAAGQERDVTAQAADTACYGADVPRNDNNIYRIDGGNQLLLGQSSTEETGAGERPTTLENVTYTSH